MNREAELRQPSRAARSKLLDGKCLISQTSLG